VVVSWVEVVQGQATNRRCQVPGLIRIGAPWTGSSHGALWATESLTGLRPFSGSVSPFLHVHSVSPVFRVTTTGGSTCWLRLGMQTKTCYGLSRMSKQDPSRPPCSPCLPLFSYPGQIYCSPAPSKMASDGHQGREDPPAEPVHDAGGGCYHPSSLQWDGHPGPLFSLLSPQEPMARGLVVAAEMRAPITIARNQCLSLTSVTRPSDPWIVVESCGCCCALERRFMAWNAPGRPKLLVGGRDMFHGIDAACSSFCVRPTSEGSSIPRECQCARPTLESVLSG